MARLTARVAPSESAVSGLALRERPSVTTPAAVGTLIASHGLRHLRAPETGVGWSATGPRNGAAMTNRRRCRAQSTEQAENRSEARRRSLLAAECWQRMNAGQLSSCCNRYGPLAAPQRVVVGQERAVRQAVDETGAGSPMFSGRLRSLCAPAG